MASYAIRKREGVKYIALPVLDELGLVYHGFSTRVGGVSTGPFSAMNLSLNAGEDKDLVEINRCMFVKALDAGNPEVYTVRQMHGTRVIRIESREHPAEEYRQAQADALVTDQPGVAIGVLTADCVPILLVDPVRRAVAAVHAGREGSLHHVSGHVVRRMARDFGSRPQDLVAAVGPCIETACYPVSEEVAVRRAGQEEYQAVPATGRKAAYYSYGARVLSRSTDPRISDARWRPTSRISSSREIAGRVTGARCSSTEPMWIWENGFLTPSDVPPVTTGLRCRHGWRVELPRPLLSRNCNNLMPSIVPGECLRSTWSRPRLLPSPRT